MPELDANTIRAIGRRLREMTRPSRTPPPQGPHHQPDGFWARIDAEASAANVHSWTRVHFDPATEAFVDWEPAITGSNNAYTQTEFQFIDAAVVWLRFGGYNADGNPVYTFQAGGGLPDGGSRYMVLQRDAEGNAIWDWVRAHG